MKNAKKSFRHFYIILLCGILFVSCQKEKENVGNPSSTQKMPAFMYANQDYFCEFYSQIYDAIEAIHEDSSLIYILENDTIEDEEPYVIGRYIEDVSSSYMGTYTYQTINAIVYSFFGMNMNDIVITDTAFILISEHVNLMGYIDCDDLYELLEQYDLSEGDAVSLYINSAIHNKLLRESQICNTIVDDGHEQWFELFTYQHDSINLPYISNEIYVIHVNNMSIFGEGVPYILGNGLFSHIDTIRYASMSEMRDMLMLQFTEGVLLSSYADCTIEWMEDLRLERERYERELANIYNSTTNNNQQMMNALSVCNDRHCERQKNIDMKYENCKESVKRQQQ